MGIINRCSLGVLPMQGDSNRNLELMRHFAKTYPELEFAKQPVSQLPWGHIIRLMQSIKDNLARIKKVFSKSIQILLKVIQWKAIMHPNR
jgi:hypothetical protein